MVASTLEAPASVRKCTESPDNNGLTPRQTRAAALLGAGRTPTQTAGELGVNVRTLGRWRALPAFEAAVSDARKAVWCEALDAVRGLLPQAVDVLRRKIREGDVGTALALLRLAVGRAGLEPATGQLEDGEGGSKEPQESFGFIVEEGFGDSEDSTDSTDEAD